MTTTGYRCAETEATRGPIKPGLAADLIAVPGNPLEKIDALRDVQFVMKDGMVFKQKGVMTPEPFFHCGPVNGWRIRCPGARATSSWASWWEGSSPCCRLPCSP